MKRNGLEIGTRSRAGRGVMTQRAGTAGRFADKSHTILADTARIHRKEQE